MALFCGCQKWNDAVISQKPRSTSKIKDNFDAITISGGFEHENRRTKPPHSLDGRYSFTARVEHLDDYHFDMGGLGNVFHICQFAEVMERNHADFYPEIQTQDEQAAWELGGKGYLAIQSCEDGWDYTIYHSDFSVMDGGQLDAPELTIQEAREQILEAHHMEKGRRLLQDYDAVMDKVAEAEELSADHRPSTLEKLAELASDTSAPKSSARSAPEL